MSYGQVIYFLYPKNICVVSNQMQMLKWKWKTTLLKRHKKKTVTIKCKKREYIIIRNKESPSNELRKSDSSNY